MGGGYLSGVASAMGLMQGVEWRGSQRLAAMTGGVPRHFVTVG